MDGTNLLYRAHHALRRSGLTHAGRPIWAVHGLLLTLTKAIEAQQPTHLLVALDTPAGCPARQQQLPQYKSTRDGPPQDLAFQLSWAPDALTQAGVVAISVDGWEADDVLASAAARFAGKVTVVTSDRDAYQLLEDGRVEVYKPDGEVVTDASLRDSQQLSPAQYADLAALRGEASDNIPGVTGVGTVTATRLLHRFGDLEAVLAADDSQLRELLGPKTISNLRTQAGQARLAKQVGRLRRDLPLGAPTEVAQLDPGQLVRVLTQVGLPAAGQKLAAALGAGRAAQAAT